MFLLDTAIVSEIRKKKPDAGVLRCVSKQKADRLFLNVVTLGEIERGIEKRRKANPGLTDGLVAWLESMTRLYADRVLPVTPGRARRWGRISAQLGHDGADLLIAATAPVHGLTVATRNSGHFVPAGVTVINPFMGMSGALSSKSGARINRPQDRVALYSSRHRFRLSQP